MFWRRQKISTICFSATGDLVAANAEMMKDSLAAVDAHSGGAVRRFCPSSIAGRASAAGRMLRFILNVAQQRDERSLGLWQKADAVGLQAPAKALIAGIGECVDRWRISSKWCTSRRRRGRNALPTADW